MHVIGKHVQKVVLSLSSLVTEPALVLIANAGATSADICRFPAFVFKTESVTSTPLLSSDKDDLKVRQLGPCSQRAIMRTLDGFGPNGDKTCVVVLHSMCIFA